MVQYCMYLLKKNPCISRPTKFQPILFRGQLYLGCTHLSRNLRWGSHWGFLPCPPPDPLPSGYTRAPPGRAPVCTPPLQLPPHLHAALRIQRDHTPLLLALFTPEIAEAAGLQLEPAFCPVPPQVPSFPQVALPEPEPSQRRPWPPPPPFLGSAPGPQLGLTCFRTSWMSSW